MGKWCHRSGLREQACEACGDKVHHNKIPKHICILEILDSCNRFLLFHHAFRALQRLSPTIGDAVDDPIALLFAGNKILLFEDTEMVREFGVRNFDNALDDTDTERLGEEGIHDR